MVGPQLGRETAESAYKIKRRLCVTALHGYYNQVGWKSGPAKAGPAGPATPPLYNINPPKSCRYRLEHRHVLIVMYSLFPSV